MVTSASGAPATVIIILPLREEPVSFSRTPTVMEVALLPINLTHHGISVTVHAPFVVMVIVEDALV